MYARFNTFSFIYIRPPLSSLALPTSMIISVSYAHLVTALTVTLFALNLSRDPLNIEVDLIAFDISKIADKVFNDCLLSKLHYHPLNFFLYVKMICLNAKKS